MSDVPSVFAFDHPHRIADAALRRQLGGKGFSLWLMTHELHLAVPPGFTIATSECAGHLAGGMRPELEQTIRAAMRRIESQTGRVFGGPTEPLLVSVRSGAASSMPGMMDTLLNVGLTPEVCDGLAGNGANLDFAERTYHRFLDAYARVVLGLATESQAGQPPEREGGKTASAPPVIEALRIRIGEHIALADLDDPWKQLFAAIGAVFNSWNSPRARAYRARENLAGDAGTAVTVQAMVFGHRDRRSGTGVAFTRNPATGEPTPCGDFLFGAQGDDVVGGTHRPLPLVSLQQALPDAYAQLATAMDRLECWHRDMCDIEFTVESGRLWLLQARTGKRSPAAAPRIAVDLVREGRVGLTRAEAVRRIDTALLSGETTMARGAATAPPIALGVAASPGVATGAIVFDADRAVEQSADGRDLILVRSETSPADVHGMGVCRGILTRLGGMMSHAAVVARAWNIPAVCGVGALTLTPESMTIGSYRFQEGDIVSIDGDRGAVFCGAIAASATQDPYLEVIREWARAPCEAS